MTMITSGCGCSAGACACSSSCCEGNDVLVPADISNAPAQPALRHRVGTHASFFESMLAHLVAPPSQAARCEGEASEEDPITSWPLRELTTRERDDPTIALLDAWAIVGDILTFYQERIANEGYLRTATEQRSVEELARLVGYRPRPGVAASIDLAFTLEREVITTIPAGTRAQSLPAPGKLPQTFETSRALLASARWNAMRPLQSKFRTPTTVQKKLEIFLAGIANNLRLNDVLLRLPPDENGNTGSEVTPSPLELYRVARVEILVDLSLTRVLLRSYTNQPIELDDEPTDEFQQQTDSRLKSVIEAFTSFDDGKRMRTDRELLDVVDDDKVLRESLRRAIEDLGASRQSATEIHAFRATSPLFGHNAAAGRFTGSEADPLAWPKPVAPYEEAGNRLFLDVVNERVQPGGYIVVDQATQIPAPSDPDDDFEVPSAQSIRDAFDEFTTFYQDMSDDERANARAFAVAVRTTATAVQAFWLTTFVDAAEDLDSDEDDDAAIALAKTEYSLGRVLATSVGLDELAIRLVQAARTLPDDDDLAERITNILDGLDKGAEDAQGGGGGGGGNPVDAKFEVYRIESVSTHSRDAYGIAKQTLDLTLGNDAKWYDWAPITTAFLDPLRSVVTFNESEQLSIGRTPLVELEGDMIDLEGLVFDLEPGRHLIVEGEDADVPGARRTERVTISSVEHDLIEVSTHVTLTKPLRHAYLRSKTIIYGNVAAATQGESRREVLGSGDASKPSQRFVLRHQPLTHVPAATASGAASTLTVRVQGFAWPEVEHRMDLRPRDRNIITERDEQGRTIVVGGDGRRGARFPTGVENVVAEYRSGQGADGNIEPHKATNLATRPFGVQKVTNPLGASGGADPDDIESTRLRAPLAVEALDRLLSVEDYRSFALNFAGITKAEALRVGSDDVFGRWRIRTIVAGLAAEPLDPESELMVRLGQAMRRLGDPSLELELVPAKLQRLSLRAKLAIAPGYAFVDVEPLVRARLLDALGYARRDIGRSIPPSRIAALIQAVVGVAFVDLDELSTSETNYDLDPLVFDPDAPIEDGGGGGGGGGSPGKSDAKDTMIVAAADSILYLDPTQPDTIVLEELTP